MTQWIIAIDHIVEAPDYDSAIDFLRDYVSEVGGMPLDSNGCGIYAAELTNDNMATMVELEDLSDEEDD